MKPDRGRNLLTLRPLRCRDSERTEEGTLQVLLPRFSEGRFGRAMQKLFGQKYGRLSLDDHGAFVWERCDGEHSVHEIAEAWAEHFDDRDRHLERCALFVRTLVRGNCVTLLENPASSEQGS